MEKPTSSNYSSRYTPPPRTCYLCQQPGHIAQECLRRSRDSEAHGRVQKAARTATLESKSQCEVPSKPENLSTHELENILARRLSEEGRHLTDVSMNVVSSSVPCVETEAVGSTLSLQVSVEGVPVDVLVDTGFQSTIISRSMLHSIACKQKEGGLPPPTLELPTARLFGQDGRRGGCELVITAQLKVRIEVDWLLANVIAFVQPDSEQQCLLGMNALPALGLTVR